MLMSNYLPLQNYIITYCVELPNYLDMCYCVTELTLTTWICATHLKCGHDMCYLDSSSNSSAKNIEYQTHVLPSLKT